MVPHRVSTKSTGCFVVVSGSFLWCSLGVRFSGRTSTGGPRRCSCQNFKLFENLVILRVGQEKRSGNSFGSLFISEWPSVMQPNDSPVMNHLRGTIWEHLRCIHRHSPKELMAAIEKSSRVHLFAHFDCSTWSPVDSVGSSMTLHWPSTDYLLY